MTGILQDKLYIEKLNETISCRKTEIGKYAPSLVCLIPKEKKLPAHQKTSKEKPFNQLLGFLGDSISNRRNNNELKELYKKYKRVNI